MPEYFDGPGEPSSEAGRFVHVDDVAPLLPMPGLEFRPVTTDTVMANLATFEPNAEAPEHHHAEEQIAIVLTGELAFTLGSERKVMRPGECAIIPPHVPHSAAAGPEGCRVLDVFTPPRAAIRSLMG